MEKKRVLWLDIAKALGILVVLLVHTGKSLGPVTFFGGMFYMPVFFILAGMTFRWKPEETFGSFVKKKARRLLLPYFGYNLFLFLFFFIKNDLLTGQAQAASFFPLLGILYSRNCLFPMNTTPNIYFMQILNAPTWFLTCMFVSYLVFWLLMRAAGGSRKKALYLNFGVLLAAVLLHYLCPVLLPWSLDCALYSVSFLLIGKIMADRELVESLYRKPWALILTAAAFAGLSWLNGSVNMSVADYGRSMILYLAVGSLGSLFVMELSLFLEKYTKKFAEALGFLGRHTLPVLCLHLFVYSMLGTVLRLAGILA
ncbi:MAG TPA: acyltransferase [Candidatus Merdisoma merdipullorum]|nr:acyltransferase [Candidatus Merdisoma merdipullorum]